MEFAIGGMAAASAGFFTNPIEVVKHHIELNKKSPVNHKYRNFLQAGIIVTQKDGLKSLQKGLQPALCAHLTSYGMKLGTYNYAQKRGYTTNTNGEVIVPMSVGMSAAGGVLGQYLSSPFYLIKAEGELDHAKKDGYAHTIQRIYKEHGLRGFFRGATASLPRAFIGTSQLTSFALAKENLNKFDTFQRSPLLTTFLASSLAGVVLSVAMTPFEMVLTKLYKQAIGPKTAEKVYTGFIDCVKKTYFKQGLKPFYSGVGPIYLKLGPHTVLCLMFWEEFKGLYDSYEKQGFEYSNSHLPKTKGKFYEKNFGVLYNENSEFYW